MGEIHEILGSDGFLVDILHCIPHVVWLSNIQMSCIQDYVERRPRLCKQNSFVAYSL